MSGIGSEDHFHEDDDDDAELPSDLPEEAVRTLVEKVSDELRKIGLYVNAVQVAVDTDEDEAERKHILMMNLTLGSVAFSKRVQDPETDNFDFEFKKIELGTTFDNVLDIVGRYKDGYDIEVGDEDDGDEEPA